MHEMRKLMNLFESDLTKDDQDILNLSVNYEKELFNFLSDQGIDIGDSTLEELIANGYFDKLKTSEGMLYTYEDENTPAFAILHSRDHGLIRTIYFRDRSDEICVEPHNGPNGGTRKYFDYDFHQNDDIVKYLVGKNRDYE